MIEGMRDWRDQLKEQRKKMTGNLEEAELLAQLTAAEQAIVQTIQEAGIDVEVAAAACAALAGKYTALAAANHSLLLAPLLREAVGTLIRRAEYSST